MTEVVINKCFGGFSLSQEATIELARRKGIKLWSEPSEIDREHGHDLETAFVISHYTVPPEEFRVLYEADKLRGNYKLSNAVCYSSRDTPRDDPDLVAVVRELRHRANGSHAKLVIVQVPDDVEWEIDEYDGLEHVAEKHRTWA